MLRLVYTPLIILLWVFGQVVNASALLFLKAPPLEVVQESTVTLSLAPMPGQSAALDSCGVYQSAYPAGAQVSGHTRLPKTVESVKAMPPSLQIQFKPSEGKSGAQLKLEVHYLVAACKDGASVSPEFPIRVVTTRSPTVLSPAAQEPSVRPEISWTRVPGVPAYHVLLSDQPMSIDASQGTISGASVIWQAIVSGDRIVYGDPDPSGNFNKVPPPPLAPNIEYNLVLLNNYDGKTAINTSVKAQSLKLFTLKPAIAPLSVPKVLLPMRGTQFKAPMDSVIRFRWNTARANGRNANTYRLFVYVAESQQGVTVLRPVWQTEGTDTTADLMAKSVLLKARYVTKVFALDAEGSGTVSDTVSFEYDSEIQNLKLGARKKSLSGDTVRVGNARIVATALDGSGASLPMYTLTDALLNIPFTKGRYRIEIIAEGCEAYATEQILSGGATLILDPVLSVSPSRILGDVADSEGRAISNVDVTVTASDGNSAMSQTDAQGRFMQGVQPGSLRLLLNKADYQPWDTLLTAELGKTLNLGQRVLQKSTGFLSGSVRTTDGSLLPATNIEIRDSADKVLIRTAISDAQGGFHFFLTPASYRVSAVRTGYTGIAQTVKLRVATDITLTLTAGASVVKVSIQQKTVLSTGAVVAPLETATISVQSVLGGASLSTRTDVNGAASLSVAETGDFWIKAAHPDVYTDSMRVTITQPKSTKEGALTLLRYATLSGRIQTVPDSLIDPSTIRISLLPLSGGNAVASILAEAIAKPDSLGRYSFSLEHIETGTYAIAVGSPKYFAESQPTVSVTKGQRLDTFKVVLRKAATQIAFKLKFGDSEKPGNIQLRVPYAEQFATGIKKTLGAGTLVLNAETLDSTLLPLNGLNVMIPATLNLDTTITLPLLAAHDVSKSFLKSGYIGIPIKLLQSADSGSVSYSSRLGKWDTLKISSVELRMGNDTILIPAPAQGGVLQYVLSLQIGNFTYGQSLSNTTYRIELPRDSGLGEVYVTQGDSLILPSGSRCRISLQTLSKAGDALDAAKSTATFLLPVGFPGMVESISGMSAIVKTNAIIEAKKGIKSQWNTLKVTVTYIGQNKSTKIPIKVGRFQVQQLKLVSLAGDAPFIPSPQNIPLQVTAYDTTTSPPTSLLMNPEFQIIPEEAGLVDAMGILKLDSSFIGPVHVWARHRREDGVVLSSQLFQERDSILRGLSVGQTIKPTAGKQSFYHTRRVELLSPDSAFPEGGVLRFVPHKMPRTFASARASSLDGLAYEVSNPLAVSMKKPLEIRLTPSPGRNIKHTILRRFDAKKFKWFDFSDTTRGDANAFGRPYVSGIIDTLENQYFGLFIASEPLGLSLFEIIPNPFSPQVIAIRDGNTQLGTRIRFRPESDSSAEVTVTMRIYNQAGEPIRTLSNYRTFSKVETELYWNGVDDRGRKVRNGRYYVNTTLTSTGGGKTKSWVKPVVVFE